MYICFFLLCAKVLTPLSQYIVKPPFTAITAASLLGFVSTSFAHLETEFFCCILCERARAQSDLTDSICARQFSELSTDSWHIQPTLQAPFERWVTPRWVCSASQLASPVSGDWGSAQPHHSRKQIHVAGGLVHLSASRDASWPTQDSRDPDPAFPVRGLPGWTNHRLNASEGFGDHIAS